MKQAKDAQRRATAMVALAGICWSFAGVLGKFALWNPLSLVGFRSLIAALLLGWARKSFRPANTLWNWLGGLGVVGTATLFMYANRLTSSANAIVMQYAMTAIVIVLQAVIFHVKPRKADVAAAVFVMGGVILCFFQGMGEGKLTGNLLALFSAGTWALVFIAARMPGVDAMNYAYQGNLLGCIFLLNMPMDAGIGAGGLTGWLAAIAMGMCLGFGYLCFGKGMQTGISPTAAAVVSNIEPVLNPTWVLLFFGENPGILSIWGAVVVLATVTIYSLQNVRND